MSAVEFFYEDTDAVLANPKKTQDWIHQIISKSGYGLIKLNYIFCSDEYLHRINLEYLQHDNYTDIITFDQSEKEKEIEGDIYISIERVEDNSRTLENTFDHELHRVIIHGVLHLLGFSDKTPEQKDAMRKKEDSCLSLYFD